jgi:O-antigen ligase
MIAISASLPMAWVSISKALLVATSLGYLATSYIKKKSYFSLEGLLTSKAIISIFLLFVVSLIWTHAETHIALLTLLKHGKIIEILLLISLIHDQKEARIGILAFLTGQTFLIFISYLLAAGAVLPWVNHSGQRNVVFSSYLDQSIMFASTAALFWHLKTNRAWTQWVTGFLSIAALVNVFLLLDGRSGYAVALTVFGLAAMWAMPKKLRIAALLGAPTIALVVLFFGSNQVQERSSKIFHETQEFEKQGKTESSSGWRLNAWHKSIEAISEKPWLGHGVGSWTITVKRIQGEHANKVFGEGQASNPHQEYLLWGVELGAGGPLLLLLLIACIVHDAKKFPEPIARATISFALAMAVACAFNSAIYDALIGDYFCVVLGLLMALGIRNQKVTSNTVI